MLYLIACFCLLILCVLVGALLFAGMVMMKTATVVGAWYQALAAAIVIGVCGAGAIYHASKENRK